MQPASDCSLLVTLGENISLDTHQRVVKLLRLLEAAPLRGVRNLHPAYSTLLVQFDPVLTAHETLEHSIQELLRQLDSVKLPPPALVEIPVCYGGEFGPDLPDVAELHGLSPEEVVRLHSEAVYTVYFLGFVPGFAYLGGLPDAIATPRLPAPRKRVEAGSVGIAGNQSGVYPFPTPGGWRLIGKTPRPVFQAEKSLLSIGDQVRFRPISLEEFREWKE
jgi:KipI family sensor histidine kinase inhibitor